jgi:CubicO group peptidase (beta-lactamase class C family)
LNSIIERSDEPLPTPMKSAGVLVLLGAVGFGAATVSGAQGDAETRFDRLSTAVVESMKEAGVPGAALGVFAEGRTFTRGFGMTSVDNPLTVTDETLFQIGSISKTLTGTLVMQLVERGRLDLDAPVRRYLPDFTVRDREASAAVKVRDLLTHVAGWEGDLFLDTGDGDDALARYVQDMAKLEQIAPFGAFYSYNNSCFSVAGRLIEVVTGKSYEAAWQEMLVSPLGLKQTFLRPQDVLTRRFVSGHSKTPRGSEVALPWALSRAERPMGGVVMSVRDLLRYGAFHLGDGSGPGGVRLLKPETLARMKEPVLIKQGTEDEMALSWHRTREGGILQVSHGGATVGQIALLLLVPERQFAVAILTNSGSGRQVTRDVSRAALKEFLDVTITDPPERPVEPSELEALVGLYSRPYADLEVAHKDGRLLVTYRAKAGFPDQSTPVPPPGPPDSYGFYKKDGLIALEGPSKGSRGEVLRRSDGSVGWIRMGRIYRRQDAPAAAAAKGGQER